MTRQAGSRARSIPRDLCIRLSVAVGEGLENERREFPAYDSKPLVLVLSG